MGGSGSTAQVIVIGSGIAGLAAANDLAQKGFQITVLQANNYIGGRLKSKNVSLTNGSTFAFDYGASWIHGSCKNNPITQLSKHVPGVKMVQTDDDSIVNYDENGEEVDDKVQKQYEAYEKMLQKADDFQGLSYYDAFKKIDPSKLQNKFFMYNVSNDVQFQTSAPLNDLSAEYGQDDDQYEGKQMLICSGYQEFAEHLSHHDNIKVLLNHPVSEVIHEEGKSIVKCHNGATFEGAIVVIAVPLGVLKSRNIKFVPQLPNWKQQAIQKLHFGNVCKILIVLKDKKIKNKQHYIGVIQGDVNKRGSASYFLNISGIASLPALMTFGLGANADELETISENSLKQLIASRISVFADEQFTANDFQIVRTNWRTDLNFRGTYTYSGVETKPSHWKDIAKPVFANNWYFCGQHTHSKYRGTVHGAYLSGKDVAGCILGQVKQQNWKYKGASEGADESEGSDEEKPKKQRKNKEEQSQSEKDKKEKRKPEKRQKKEEESSSEEDKSQKKKQNKKRKNKDEENSSQDE